MLVFLDCFLAIFVGFTALLKTNYSLLADVCGQGSTPPSADMSAKKVFFPPF